MELNQISDVMTTEEISEAWETVRSEFVSYASVIREAVDNRLEELEFDEETFDWGENEEVDKLLELRETLDTVCDLQELLRQAGCVLEISHNP